jgi:hypothetical protein
MRNALFKLRKAVTDESRQHAVQLARCEALLKKMMDFQQGVGEMPTIEDFIAWRDGATLSYRMNRARRGALEALDLPEVMRHRIL